MKRNAGSGNLYSVDWKKFNEEDVAAIRFWRVAAILSPIIFTVLAFLVSLI